MNRIDQLFKTKKGNILSIYFTAGYPLIDSTVTIINYLADAGIDMVEIGMPFSDPLADGPVIQKSSEIALHNGMTVRMLFRQLADIRRKVKIPLLLMGYINPVLKFGLENFCKKCHETGIDGVILPDMPPDAYQEKDTRLFEKYDMKNIFLISPRSDENRIKMIDSISTGFIYMVSSSSTTGIKSGFSEEQKSYFTRIKKMNLVNPRLIGFGVSDSDAFTEACSMADGAVIGSAFMKILGDYGTNSEAIREFANKIRGGNLSKAPY